MDTDCSFIGSCEEMEFEDNISDRSTVRSFSSSGFADGVESEGTLSDASVGSNENISNKKKGTLKHRFQRDVNSEPLAKKPVSRLIILIVFDMSSNTSGIFKCLILISSSEVEKHGHTKNENK